MAVDVIFEPNSSNVTNLETLSRDSLLTHERRICEIHEIADSFVDFTEELLSVGMTICEIFSLLSESEILPHPSFSSAVQIESNFLRLNNYSKNIAKSDRAVFCSLVYEILLKRGHLMSEKLFLPTDEIPETFTYVKNAFADEAYDIFSQEFRDPRVVYSKSFKEALALLTDGTVSYCLLPIEERGIRLSTVSELLFRGDFKIASITAILGFDGLADMKYALISRSFASLDFLPDDDRYLEIRLPKDAKVSISEIFMVAEQYRLDLYKLNTMRFDTEAGERDYFSLIFSTSGSDFIEMLIYLTLFADEFVPIGVYKNIE